MLEFFDTSTGYRLQVFFFELYAFIILTSTFAHPQFENIIAEGLTSEKVGTVKLCQFRRHLQGSEYREAFVLEKNTPQTVFIMEKVNE